jgi:cell division protein FtsQ
MAEAGSPVGVPDAGSNTPWMSRSIAAEPARRRAAPRSSARKQARPPLALQRRLGRGAALARAASAFAWRRRRLRIALLAALIALPLLAGGWMWFRQSSFVAVQRVQISRVHGVDAQAVQGALAAAARRMSTLDVDTASLSAAVAPFRVVREVKAVPRFPHALSIEVVEQLPVAALDVSGVRTAVAADGVVLGPSLLSGSLPTVVGARVPRAGEHVSAPGLLAALSVLGAAPAPLARHVERAYMGPRGLTVAMRNGLLVFFGDASRPRAKWLSFAQVLADPSSAGASYVDVRLPARPAAGFPAGVTPPAASSWARGSSEPAEGNTESTVASLAAALTGGSGSTPTGDAQPAGATASGTSASAPESASESASESAPESATAASTSTTAGSEPEEPQADTAAGG